MAFTVNMDGFTAVSANCSVAESSITFEYGHVIHAGNNVDASDNL